jgi:hypothetical protein
MESERPPPISCRRGPLQDTGESSSRELRLQIGRLNVSQSSAECRVPRYHHTYLQSPHSYVI